MRLAQISRLTVILLLSLTFGVGFHVLLPDIRPVHACSGGHPSPTPQHFIRASAVFSGVVVLMLPYRGPAWFHDHMIDDLDIIRVWLIVTDREKGWPWVLAEVWTPAQASACGYTFEPGAKYRIHTRQERDGRHYVGGSGAPVEWLSSQAAAQEDVRGVARGIGTIAALAALGAAAGLVWYLRNRSTA